MLTNGVMTFFVTNSFRLSEKTMHEFISPLLKSDRAIWFLQNHIGDIEECNMIRRTCDIVHDYHLVTISANQSSKR